MNQAVQWPADKVERWPIDRLIPYARNSRTHSEGQIRQIAASMREFGWTIPCLVSEDGTIIAGHGRIEAARALGCTEVPVMVAVGWTVAQLQSYVIADNKLAMNAGWDVELLAASIEDLRDAGADLDLLGFTSKELGDLVGDPNFDPSSSDDQSKLDQLSPKLVTCPHCGNEFDSNTAATPKG